MTHISWGLSSSEALSRRQGLMSACEGTHFSFVPCKSEKCTGLWRRGAKLQILNPGFGVSSCSESCYQPVTEQTLKTPMSEIFQVPTLSFSLRSVPGSEMLKSTSSEINSLPLRCESFVLDVSNLMLQANSKHWTTKKPWHTITSVQQTIY